MSEPSAGRPEDYCARLREGWAVIADLMVFSVNPLGPQEQLETVLDYLQRLPWLKTRRRGAILLRNSRGVLVMVARAGMTEERAAWCERAAIDRCGCGQVAKSGAMAWRVCEGDLEREAVTTAGDGESTHFILPLADDGRIFGVVPVFIEPGHVPSAAEEAFMQDLARVLSGIMARRMMEEVIQVREMELEEKQAEVIRKLGAASEYRDSETGMHVMRMSHYAGAIAKAMGRSVEDRERLVMAAPMHDVGKIGVPDAVLLKPGKLSEEEFESMKLHARIGAELLDGDDVLMRAAREIAHTHHEKWNGTGYPAGLKGEEIPLDGRICSVADVFDALTSNRPYKRAWTVEDAVRHIRDEAGRSFDPGVVEAFEAALPEILRIRELYRDEIIDPRNGLTLPPVPEVPDAWMPWDDSIRIGIDVIDEHHRYLFDLTNDLHRAIHQRRGSREVGRVLRALERYTVIHFREEERMMERYGYSDFDRHVRLHQAFRGRIAEFWSDFRAAPLTIGFEMVYYLRDWLVQHIRREDSRMHELLG
jgi:hemerythrin-like metal-binding protein